MNKLLVSLKSIWCSIKFLSQSICNKVIGGTGQATKIISKSISTIMAILIMVCVLILLGSASIPYGIFQRTQDFTHCEECGQTNTDLFRASNGRTVCQDCLP